MPASRFVEILDASDLPYSHDNVSLEDVLEDARHRSQSSSASSTSSTETSPSRGQTITNTAAPVKTRSRGFSLKKSKS